MQICIFLVGQKIEFFLVGDSFVHGACVNEKDTISGNIRKKIKPGSVLNLGYGDNGPLLEYATLREYLPLTNTKKNIIMRNTAFSSPRRGPLQKREKINCYCFISVTKFTRTV